MKTFTNNTITFQDTQLLKEAIEFITDEKVQYDSIDKNSFTLYNYIRVTTQTNNCKVEFNSKSIELSDIDGFLNFLLIQTTNVKGLSHLRDRGTYFDNLNQKEQSYINKLSFYPFFEEAGEKICGKLLYDNTTPEEFKEEFDLSVKFIRILRKENRKIIISDIVDELTSDNKKYLAA